jgi:hypothetical protein
MDPPRPAYVSAHNRATLARTLLVTGAVVSLVSAVATPFQLLFPQLITDQDPADNPGGAVVVLLLLGIVLLQVVISIATYVFFAMWLHRSCKNLLTFGTPRNLIQYSPAWAVGSFFVPFANLVVPYRAIKELWSRSVPAHSYIISEPTPPALFPLWWLFWLLSGIVGNISLRVSQGEAASPEAVVILGIVADVLSIIAAAFAIVVIGQIDHRQEVTSKTLALTGFQSPPPPPIDLGSVAIDHSSSATTGA